jgi:CRISPR-associated protein (TIGR03986 family)
MSQKPAVRVRTADGKPREWKSLHTALGGQTFIRVYAQPGNIEFILTADSSKQLDALRDRLAAAGVEEIVGGDTTIAVTPASRPTSTRPNRPGGFQQGGGPPQRQGQPQRGGGQQRPQHGNRPAAVTKPLPGKPYGFVALAQELTTAPPVWHDGTRSQGRLSGEIRFELETLTPLLVGWERGQVGDSESDWPVPANLPTVGPLANNKSVLCPLRAPWGQRPVIIPGDSLKGLLRHELGVLLGAPMERVAERSYSYRPNQKFPYDQRDSRYRQGTAVLEPRLARVRTRGTADIGGKAWPVPQQLDVLSMATREQQEYFPRREGRGRDAVTVRPTLEAEPYRGGLGGGLALPEQILAEDARRKVIHTHIDVSQLHVEHEGICPSAQVIERYTSTLQHLLDVNDGHFSARHPYVGTDQQKQGLGREAVEAGAARASQPGDLIWVEWDTEKKCIVSLGWHYYYRWAYTDTVRKTGGRLERHGLFPLNAERELDGNEEEIHRPPQELSAVRRLFGYTGDNDGSAGIGKGDHSQLMGRIFVNAALEVVGENDTEDARFLPPTFLKELGMPRPSAVEHYLKQPYHPRSRPSDKSTLVTYGDAVGYDDPGELAGRKFYLDRKDAYGTDGKGLVPGPAADSSSENGQNERSTLALEASKPGRKFRFTVRFRDLDAAELAAILVALCPDQFKGVLGGTNADGYCSKLGYARPLGWGSVRIEARQLLLLDEAGEAPTLKLETDPNAWVKTNHRPTAPQDEWLAIHRRNHPNAADYPRKDGQIYTFHTGLRAEHSRNRRYRT